MLKLLMGMGERKILLDASNASHAQLGLMALFFSLECI